MADKSKAAASSTDLRLLFGATDDGSTARLPNFCGSVFGTFDVDGVDGGNGLGETSSCPSVDSLRSSRHGVAKRGSDILAAVIAGNCLGRIVRGTD